MAKKLITKKQKIILLLLYCFRFLNSKQIQQFLVHQDHRRINSWLKDLEEKGYIIKEFKPIYGILTKPAVCYLSSLGRKYIKDSFEFHYSKYLKRISRDNKASKAFQIRCQIIADWYLQLIPSSKKRVELGKTKKDDQFTSGITMIDNILIQLTTDIGKGQEKIPLNSLQFFTPAYFVPFSLLSEIKPDAYTRKKTHKGISHGFLFALDSYIPRFLLRYNLKHIFEILDEEDWEDDESIESLSIYFLCPNYKIIIYLKRILPSFLENYYGNKTLNFHFATRNQIFKPKNGVGEKIKWIRVSSQDEM